MLSPDGPSAPLASFAWRFRNQLVAGWFDYMPPRPQGEAPVRVVRSLETCSVRRQLDGTRCSLSREWIWVTPLLLQHVPTAGVVALGHQRWDIENHGFNELVNGWISLHLKPQLRPGTSPGQLKPRKPLVPHLFPPHRRSGCGIAAPVTPWLTGWWGILYIDKVWRVRSSAPVLPLPGMQAGRGRAPRFRVVGSGAWACPKLLPSQFLADLDSPFY